MLLNHDLKLLIYYRSAAVESCVYHRRETCDVAKFMQLTIPKFRLKTSNYCRVCVLKIFQIGLESVITLQD